MNDRNPARRRPAPPHVGRLRLPVMAALLLALAASPHAARAADGGQATSMDGVVNVNTASAVELQELPGIGESRARAIIDARAQRGGFASLDELVEVKGIGEALLVRLRPYLRLEGETTVGR